MPNKSILYLTGTRADFGKLKSLIQKTESTERLETHLFVTGMHMLAKYGMTAKEVEKSGFKSIYKYINQNDEDSMDVILSKTIQGLSDYVKELKPDMIVVHGDRVEALAGAIVGALNNILVAHIEGGEVSGTIDELIRHSVSKMAHLHFVSNANAKARLLQLGEKSESIYVIGSPDLDIMKSKSLPSLAEVKSYYEIPFQDYGIVMYHPVTTEVDKLKEDIASVREALEKSGKQYVVIYPNNDHGSSIIIDELVPLQSNPKFRVFPSVRFESFLTLLKYSQCIVGNSSAGVREAPFYGLPSINVGSRQNGRAAAKSIFNVPAEVDEICQAISLAHTSQFDPEKEFGGGDSDEHFIKALVSEDLWQTSKQKLFVDI
ncbi:UDP-N-acetylglucosamine 2-epimerase (hydrolyzing) [Shewanella sp. KX20019]|uniref:UDP-N-acetylglucosamine 2-epimerase n=1 Tax=Shewanella sp. KX20019 TaxID=2803864 RepID=UPI0019292DC5|nr:UDP-N-acetylglucosamine 2-epimerase [Shewanella sp. KX20019]QQX80383.1 UDP-N-acetylglucosamine 2-epimerase (hydrolyzing) [Shewanella sp. KX20019]